LSNWVHFVPSILKQGRTTHLDGKPIGDEEVEPEELLKREVQKDPWEPRLKPISDDAAHKAGTPAWIVRTYGIKDAFMNPQQNKCVNDFSTVHVRSTWWPGAHVFYHQQKSMFIYCGDGQKHET